MSRPTTTDDVKDRWHSVGDISMDEISDQPALLKAAASFMEAIQKAGGAVEKNYSRVQLKLAKDEEQLETTLGYEQRQWDLMDKKYEAALVSIESIEEGDLNWEQREIRRWAKDEGRTDPFIVSEIEGLLEGRAS
jgi:hypothetical protein